MAQSIRKVMTVDPVTVADTTSVRQAAKIMKAADIGDVLVLRNSKVCGILTDRDLVVRAMTQDKKPSEIKVSEVCSTDVTSITSRESVEEAVRLMRERAIRRIPVVDGGEPVGMVSLGDLAGLRDPYSALADISMARPNG